MSRRSTTLGDPQVRMIRERLSERRCYHLEQAAKYRRSQRQVVERARRQMAAARRQELEHARHAADTLEILEVLA